jgi:hypothetical protein
VPGGGVVTRTAIRFCQNSYLVQKKMRRGKGFLPPAQKMPFSAIFALLRAANELEKAALFATRGAVLVKKSEASILELAEPFLPINWPQRTFAREPGEIDA